MHTSHTTDVRKAVVLAAGLSTRFLPLSKSVPKELWPLIDRPVAQYLVEEMKESGITDVIFVLNEQKKQIFTEYFRPSPHIEKTLKANKKEELLEELRKVDQLTKGMKFSFVVQKQQLGDAHALLQAEAKLKKEPFVLFFCDDIIDARVPCTKQLLKVFKTYQKPLLALARVSEDKASSYGMCELKKIAHKLHQIQGTVEKPKENPPSDCAIVGRYIFTHEIFEYIKREKKQKKEEMRVSSAINAMAREGNMIYGYEVEGKWLECGSKEKWLESTFALALKDQRWKEKIKKMLS